MKKTMIDPFVFQRTELRRRMLAQRNQLPAKTRSGLERQLSARLRSLPVMQDTQCFFVYCSCRSEVATWELIDWLLAVGKTVCVPLTEPATATMQAVVVTCPQTDLVPGYKGIAEPAPFLLPEKIHPPERLEIALIPGSVFDRRGYRLGYGGGYYDRFLTRAAPQALRIGLAFSVQVVDCLPELPHDVPMDMLVTEEEILRWPRHGPQERDAFWVGG